MKKQLTIAIILALGLGGLSACSSSQTSEDGVSDDVPSADAGTDAVPADSAENATSATPDSTATASTDGTTPAPDEAATASTDQPAPPADLQAPPPVDNSLAVGTSSDATAAATTETTGESSMASSGVGESYMVHQGDTLMKIAFEVYGDLYKWKDIYEANKDKIQNPNMISSGVSLTVQKSEQAAPSHHGEKFLIRQGDTLGTIANDVYGTPHKWKKIWKNNKDLIKDPNRIFAGFYLYYTMSPEDQRELEQLKGSSVLGNQDQQQPQDMSAPQTMDQGQPAPQALAPATPDQRNPASVPMNQHPNMNPTAAAAH